VVVPRCRNTVHTSGRGFDLGRNERASMAVRDGSKEHQREGGRLGRFVGPNLAGGARRGLHP
jgi:hypothetical protein